MIRAVVCGLLLAAGAWCVLRGLFPPRASLEHSLAEVPAAEREASPGTQLRNRWARLALRLLRLSRADPVSLRQDLAVTGTSVAEHATDRLTAGALGAVTSGAVLVIIGQTDPLLLVGALVVGFLAFSREPASRLRVRAARRRREFTDAVTAYISLVSVSISGGGGVMGAMSAAASFGSGWPLEQIRFTLDRAAQRNLPPWRELERLGDVLGIPSLVELGSAMSLAGESGTQVSDSLGARAHSARARELSERLADEERKSETLGIPVVFMLLGWMGFLGYPAIAGLLAL